MKTYLYRLGKFLCFLGNFIYTETFRVNALRFCLAAFYSLTVAWVVLLTFGGGYLALAITEAFAWVLVFSVYFYRKNNWREDKNLIHIFPPKDKWKL
jgi:hypothetical protein